MAIFRQLTPFQRLRQLVGAVYDSAIENWAVHCRSWERAASIYMMNTGA
jgi:hypothetical protein